tara:strand:- start:245 stop:574 length:330 start_codon:yes stop_codon:yes gene_type:complete
MHKTAQKHIRLDIGKTRFLVRLRMPLVCQIEDEIDGLPLILANLRSQNWKLVDLVALVHIMLAEEGTSYDYHELGNHILSAGTGYYHGKVTEFLELCLADLPQFAAGHA